MNLLERINAALTAKNKLVAERPPNSELVLLFGKREIEELKEFVRKSYKYGMDKMADDCEIKISDEFRFLDMRIIPVDMDDYLDIARKL